MEVKHAHLNFIYLILMKCISCLFLFFAFCRTCWDDFEEKFACVYLNNVVFIMEQQNLQYYAKLQISHFIF